MVCCTLACSLFADFGKGSLMFTYSYLSLHRFQTGNNVYLYANGEHINAVYLSYKATPELRLPFNKP